VTVLLAVLVRTHELERFACFVASSPLPAHTMHFSTAYQAPIRPCSRLRGEPAGVLKRPTMGRVGRTLDLAAGWLAQSESRSLRNQLSSVRCVRLSRQPAHAWTIKAKTAPAAVYSQDVRFHDASKKSKFACANKQAKAMKRIAHWSRLRVLTVNTGGGWVLNLDSLIAMERGWHAVHPSRGCRRPSPMP
jgi:hypothetical protein